MDVSGQPIGPIFKGQGIFFESLPLKLGPKICPTTPVSKYHSKIKRKAVPSKSQSGLEGSRKLRFPDFMTTAQDGGKVVSLTHRPPFTPGNTPGTHFCQRLSRPQGHSATGRIMSLEKFQRHHRLTNPRPAGLQCSDLTTTPPRVPKYHSRLRKIP